MDNKPFRELSLFTGAGGGLLASKALGWTTKCAVEINKYCREVLIRRQIDGCLDSFPIWDNIETFDGRPWRNHVNLITGGFPCQNISSAGKGDGLLGAKSKLYFSMLRVIAEVQPKFVFAENSDMLRKRGLGVVLRSLALLGYDARWCVLSAGDFEAPHIRKRMWILAYRRDRAFGSLSPKEATDSSRPRCVKARNVGNRQQLASPLSVGNGEMAGRKHEKYNPWSTKSSVDRMVPELAHRVDRLKALGNGQVPIVAANAFRLLSKGLVE